MNTDRKLELQGHILSLTEIISVSRHSRHTCLSNNPEFIARLEHSRNVIIQALAAQKVVLWCKWLK
jgi:hypothetical protein